MRAWYVAARRAYVDWRVTGDYHNRQRRSTLRASFAAWSHWSREIHTVAQRAARADRYRHRHTTSRVWCGWAEAAALGKRYEVAIARSGLVDVARHVIGYQDVI